MTYTTEQTDILCMVSAVLRKIPYCYSEDSAEWITQDGIISIDFAEKEIQFLDWEYTDDVIYLQILGVAQMFNLKTEDYTRK